MAFAFKVLGPLSQNLRAIQPQFGPDNTAPQAPSPLDDKSQVSIQDVRSLMSRFGGGQTAAASNPYGGGTGVQQAVADQGAGLFPSSAGMGIGDVGSAGAGDAAATAADAATAGSAGGGSLMSSIISALFGG